VNEWIGVDLDGTLAKYHHWRGETHIGAPIVSMVERIKRWRSEGREVRIFTARISADGKSEDDVSEIRTHIEKWCKETLGEILKITNVKDYGMVELWDDRCVQVESNTGMLIGRSTRGL